MSDVPEDVRARISAEFAGETYYEALRQLGRFAFGPRVQRSLVFLARGDLEELARFARAAERDEGEVIFWAEYEDHDAAQPRRVRSMSEPFDPATRTAD